jgi:RNA polymerase sigma-54 factor
MARLRSLTRSEVAVALDLHESTVSRAVAEKYVLLPDRTTTPLATFFSACGGAGEALRRPLLSGRGRRSDQQLADLLRDAGCPMARRTVAKSTSGSHHPGHPARPRSAATCARTAGTTSSANRGS